MIVEGLEARSEGEWFQFWMDRWERFASLHQARRVLYRAAFATDQELSSAIEQSGVRCGEAASERWPQFSEGMQSALESIRGACELAATFKVLPSKELRVIDLECAQILGASITWFDVAISSLCSPSARPEIGSEVSDLLFMLVRETSSVAVRMASAAAALRDVDPAGLLLVEATISPADDGVGYVATLSPLDLETCGETAEEMRHLVKEAVRGYFRAEKMRGTLAESLAELSITGEAAHVAVSLYVREGDVTALSDVLNLSI